MDKLNVRYISPSSAGTESESSEPGKSNQK
jgi:hypothetical protein